MPDATSWSIRLSRARPHGHRPRPVGAAGNGRTLTLTPDFLESPTGGARVAPTCCFWSGTTVSVADAEALRR
jgi:hypothetical protein